MIFLSDIPGKITECVSSLHLFQVGLRQGVVNLAHSMNDFEITLELNGLLLRNSRLTPSELVRKNLIFVARTGVSNEQHYGSVAQFPEVWRSILAMRTSHETFVVSFRLAIAEFSINLAQDNEITLRFRRDSSLEALQDCDPLVLPYVEGYVRIKVKSELKKLADFSVHITSPATILQNLPPVENTSGLEDVYSSCSINLDPNQLIDASLTDIDMSLRLEKQLIFADDTDCDASDEELRILHSDDSAKGTVHEDDELYYSFSNDCLPRMNLGSILGQEIQDGGSSSSVLSIIESIDINKLDSLSPQSEPEPEPERLAATFGGCAKYKSLLISQIDQFDDEFDQIVADLESSPLKPPKAGFTGFPGERRSVSKKPSLSYIDHDEKHGLEYAFRNKSPEIPKYIKEDKKFKFIKIGKVQKFVNMFEEQKVLEPVLDTKFGLLVNRTESRMETRLASPLR